MHTEKGTEVSSIEMGHLYTSICNNLPSASNRVPDSAYFSVQLPGFNVVLSMSRVWCFFFSVRPSHMMFRVTLDAWIAECSLPSHLRRLLGIECH